MLGDFWQSPPVKPTRIAANPFEKTTARVATMLGIFWTRGQESSLSYAYFLETPDRNPDAFMVAFLEWRRLGTLSWNMCNFIHGYNTVVPGSWLPACGSEHVVPEKLECGSAMREDLWRHNRPRLLCEDTPPKKFMTMEHYARQAQRRNRCRTLGVKSNVGTIPADAPYVIPYCAPKNHTWKLRALRSAREQSKELLWIVAQDTP